MVEKTVAIEIPALDKTATKAVVTEYRVSEGIYVFDLYAGDELVAKSRYCTVASAPFELTEEEIASINLMPEEEEPADA